MKTSKFIDGQKTFILKQGTDGMPVADICRKAGISQAAYFNRKKKYDGLLPDEMRRLKQLEDENGKPTDNAFIEAFNSKLRAECLNAHWFMSPEDARQKLEDWRRYYNEDRPHSGIGQIPPILLHNSGGASGPSLGIEAEKSGFG